jgi:hypothetical protein
MLEVVAKTGQTENGLETTTTSIVEAENTTGETTTKDNYVQTTESAGNTIQEPLKQFSEVLVPLNKMLINDHPSTILLFGDGGLTTNTDDVTTDVASSTTIAQECDDAEVWALMGFFQVQKWVMS